VFLVKDKRDSQLYVMKEIDITSMGPKEKKNALREVGFLAKLSHPAIIGYREWFERVVQGAHNNTKRTLHIVMEYADAGDLSTLLKAQRRGRLPEELVVHYMVQIILALKHMHDRKIIHRDIKSENVFLTRSNQVKIGDFGISKHLENTLIARTRIGTPYYLSPEICLDRGYDAKTDMWALGVIIYQMCALRHPFDATSMEGLLHAIIHTRHRPLPSTYSKPLRDLVDALLAKNPKKRPSVYEVLKMPFVNQNITRYLNDPKLSPDLVGRLMESLAYRPGAGSSGSSSSSGASSTAAGLSEVSSSTTEAATPRNQQLTQSSAAANNSEEKSVLAQHMPAYGEVPSTVIEENEEDLLREAQNHASPRQPAQAQQHQDEYVQLPPHVNYVAPPTQAQPRQPPPVVSRAPVSGRATPSVSATPVSSRYSPYPAYPSPARGQNYDAKILSPHGAASPASNISSPVRPVPLRATPTSARAAGGYGQPSAALFVANQQPQQQQQSYQDPEDNSAVRLGKPGIPSGISEGRSPSNLPKLVGRPLIHQAGNINSPYVAVQVPSRMAPPSVKGTPTQSPSIAESVLITGRDGITPRPPLSSRRYYGSPARGSQPTQQQQPSIFPDPTPAPHRNELAAGVQPSSRIESVLATPDRAIDQSVATNPSQSGSGGLADAGGPAGTSTSTGSRSNSGAVLSALSAGLGFGSNSGNAPPVPSLLPPPNRDPNYLAFEASELARIRAENVRERHERREQRMRELRRDNIFAYYGGYQDPADYISSPSHPSSYASHNSAAVGIGETVLSPPGYLPPMSSRHPAPSNAAIGIDNSQVSSPYGVGIRSPAHPSSIASIQPRRPTGVSPASHIHPAGIRSGISPSPYRAQPSNPPQGLLAPLPQAVSARSRPPAPTPSDQRGRLAALRGAGYPGSVTPRN